MRPWGVLVPGQGSGLRVLGVGLGSALLIALLDLVLTGRLTMFFDLSFITLCLGLGQLPRRDALFVVAFAPPAVLVAAFVFLGIVDPDTLGNHDDGVFQAVLTGLIHHAAALAIGYALCLAALGLRHRELATRTG